LARLDDLSESSLRRLSTATWVAGALVMWPLIYSAIEFVSEPVLVPLAGVPVLGLFYAARHFSELANERARARMRLEASSDDRAPIVVLRSFRQDGLAFALPRRMARAMAPGASFVNRIAMSAASHGPVIAVGGPTSPTDYFDEPFLFYFQSEDDEWAIVFQSIAAAARAIVLIPGISTGVRTEMRAIHSSNLTTKTLVFMPPTEADLPAEKWLAPTVDAGRYDELWAEVQTVYASEGMQLPAYDREGALFSINPDFSCRRRVSLNGEFSLERVSEALADLLPTLANTSIPFSELYPRIRARETTPPRPGLIQRIFPV
jgi:hypothetical protein